MDKEEDKKASDLRSEIRGRTMSYVGASFGLVAGLAWNDAVKALIEYLFPFPQSGVWAKFLYALIITAVVAVLLYYLEKLINPKKEKK